MATLFHILAIAALLAAIVVWGIAVRNGAALIRADRAEGGTVPAGTLALLVFWPFAVRGRAGNTDEAARQAGKAAIAFFIALTVAVAATSAYTNLTMKRPSPAPSGAGTTPSKS